MKFWKFLLTVLSVVFASLGTLLFQPTVFCEITIPVTAKLLGWKAQAVSARLSAFGKLDIEGLEAVDPQKSRIAMDFAKVEFDPVGLLRGWLEIRRADFRFAMVDLELERTGRKKTSPWSLPISLQEMSVELVEGRLRTETGAWILKSAHASAEGWDGQSPREIRLQLGKLDWNGPGQQELATTTQATAKKSKDPAGGDLWDFQLTTDVSTVVDLPPWNLVSPCQLALKGNAARNPKGEWRVDGLEAGWQGVGGIRLVARIGGTFGADGLWTAEVDLAPTDLELLGIFLQPRGIQNVFGTLAGTVNLTGGPGRPLGVDLDLNGQTVQLAAAAGPTWPTQPSALTVSSRGEWNGKEGSLKVASLNASLSRAGQPVDFQMSLDRPAVLQLGGKPGAKAAEPASLQWEARGLEMAALAPLVITPEKLKVEGGKLSATGKAKIEGSKVGLTGRLESRAMSASGKWVQGKLAVQTASLDFAGNLEGGSRLHLETMRLQAAWEGGTAEDLEFTAKAEWDDAKKEGFLAGDLQAGLAGLGKAWSGARFWPEDGQAKAHVEFSGNLMQKGGGLISLTLAGMRWPGEKTVAWGAKLSSELQLEERTWTLPALTLQAERSGERLLDAKVLAIWKPAQDMGRVKVELAQAESSFLVPLLKNFTPDWQWSQAAGKGSFEFTRQDKHDRVQADLQASVTVETGTAQRPRPVDFSSLEGSLRASWPSASEGELSVDSLALVARHRDGTEAVRASLDSPLLLKKKGPGEWQPAGSKPSSGLVQFAGWPLGLVAPLILPEAKESSIAGTLSGFLKVQSNPGQRSLTAETDLTSADLAVDLPHLRLSENSVHLKAGLGLGADGNVAVQAISVGFTQGGQTWLRLSAQRGAQPALAVTGQADLAVLGQNAPSLAPYVKAGTLILKSNVGDPKDGIRKIGFSAEGQGLRGSVPLVGELSGLLADAQGVLTWDRKGLVSLDDLNLTAKGAAGELILGKVDFQRNGTVAWESARIPAGWVSTLSQNWLRPNHWVSGDIVLGQGFWEPGEHGVSGEMDATLLEASLSDQTKAPPLSVRIQGAWEYDNRTQLVLLKDASLLFPDFKDDPVQIASLQVGPGLFTAKVSGGVLDLRGVLGQYAVWQSGPPSPAVRPEPTRLDLAADLDRVVLKDARVGPVKIARFRYGPEGVLLEPSSVEVQGGLIRGSVVQTGGADRPLQARLFMEKFPLGAILGPMIQDARGPLGGFADLQFNGQAAGAKLVDLQRSLSGQGSFRLYQAHLENLPAIQKALQGAGAFLGSGFIAGSEINDLGATFQISGTKIATEDLRVSGTALAAGMRGSLDWMSQAIDFRLNLALTREAIQSSGQLQGVMTQLVGNSSDYYTKIPGSATITGTLADPKVQMDVGKMLAEGGINLLLNAPAGVLQGAGGAAGGAAGAAGSILQGVGNLFKGF